MFEVFGVMDGGLVKVCKNQMESEFVEGGLEVIVARWLFASIKYPLNVPIVVPPSILLYGLPAGTKPTLE